MNHFHASLLRATDYIVRRNLLVIFFVEHGLQTVYNYISLNSAYLKLKNPVKVKLK